MKKRFAWINTFAEVGKCLNEHENAQLNLENILRPNTKWVFVRFSTFEVKAVLDRQPIARLVAQSCTCCTRSGDIALNTFNNNLCLWHFIAVHREARPDRSTQAARELTNSFYELRTTPTDCPKHHWTNWIRLKGNTCDRLAWHQSL